MDAVDWARLQFAGTAGLHFLFVLVTLGLVTLLVPMQAAWLITRRPSLERAVRFWGTLYVINYLVGIASGLVMEFQFGLSWSGLSHTVGNVIGAPLAVETLVAFVLESTLLGLWIAGWHRIRPGLHFALLGGVALTAYLSVFWIMVANAYLQNPVGHEIRADGTAVLTDLGALVTNPTLTLALWHVAGAALACGGFLMAGISAWHLLRHRAVEFRGAARYGLITGTLALGLSFGSGFAQYGAVAAVQPIKYGDDQQKLAAANSFSTQFGGTPSDYLPPGWLGTVTDVMVNIAFLLGVFAYLLPLLYRDWLLRWRPTLILIIVATPLPFAAAISGWLLREIGRAPFAVYGLLPAEAAMTPRSPLAAAVTCLFFLTLVASTAALNWTLLLRTAGRGLADPPLGRTTPIPADDRAPALT